MRGLALTLFLISASSSALAATATGTASANVLAPLAIEQINGLHFGDILAGESNTKIASFELSGSPDMAYSVSVDPSVILVGPGDDLTASLSLVSGETGDLSASGLATVEVSGELVVPAGQVAGAYSGTYTISANYQ
jgi:hypothetical protein